MDMSSDVTIRQDTDRIWLVDEHGNIIDSRNIPALWGRDEIDERIAELEQLIAH